MQEFYQCIEIIYCEKGVDKMRKWTKQTAEEYIRKCKEKGLKYWSARDFLRNHRTMNPII